MPTEVETLIQRYRSGELSLDQLADSLASRAYKLPSYYEMSPERSHDQVGLPPEEGTWEETSSARARGVLTAEEYDVILRRHGERFGG